VYDAGRREAYAIAELGDAIVELHGARKGIERGAEFGATPIGVRPFRRVLDGGWKTEGAVYGESAAPFHFHFAGRGDERVHMQPLAQRDGGGSIAAASTATAEQRGLGEGNGLQQYRAES
jgi:hypothetical protein